MLIGFPQNLIHAIVLFKIFETLFMHKSIEAKEEIKVLTCENDTSSLSCHPYFGIILMDVFWGRKNKKDCPYKQKKGVMLNKTHAKKCEEGIDQDYIHWRVEQVCEKMNSCTIPASTAFFDISDPCPDVYKYMELTYTCSRYDISTWTSSSVYY